jgi:hypothetical protein
VTSVRTVAGLGLGTALLGVLSGCSSGTEGGALAVSAAISAAPTATGTGGVASKKAAALNASLFGGSKPASVAYWWDKHPDAAPPDLADRTLLLNREGTGPRRFLGPDMRKYSKVLMIITCTEKVEYELRLQVLDGLSIATTSGSSCGGPNLSSYQSPNLKVVDPQTEVEVEVPAGTKYFVTLYGKRK